MLQKSPNLSGVECKGVVRHRSTPTSVVKSKVCINNILVPHNKHFKYGIPESDLAKNAPETFLWLRYYQKELIETRIQNGKFCNPKLHPFYRLDNVG